MPTKKSTQQTTDEVVTSSQLNTPNQTPTKLSLPISPLVATDESPIKDNKVAVDHEVMNRSDETISSPLDVSIALLPRNFKVDVNSSLEILAKRKNYLEHSTLIKLLKTFGLEVSDDGVCYGFMTLARMSILAGQFDVFKKRLDFINQNTPSSIEAALKLISQKQQRGEPLDERDERYIDMLAFMKSVAIAQAPQNYKHLLSSDSSDWFHQGDSRSIQLIQSIMLENLQGESEVMRFTGMFNLQDIEFMLNAFERTLDEVKSQSAVSLELKSLGHAMQISYSPKKQWHFVDVNQLEKLKKPAIMNMKNLAQSVYNGYLMMIPADKSRAYPYLATACRLITTNANTDKPVIKRKFMNQKEFRSIRNTKEHANLIDPEGNTWPLIAAREKDDITIDGYFSTVNSKDFKGKKTIDLPDKYGCTPLLIAVLFNNVTMVNKLLAAGADPNLKEIEGRTPLNAAVICGQIDIVKALLQDKRTRDLPDNRGDQLIHNICINGNVALGELCLKALKSKQFNLNAKIKCRVRDRTQSSDNGVLLPEKEVELTPIQFALYNGHAEFATFLYHQGASLDDAINYTIETESEDLFKWMLQLSDQPTLKMLESVRHAMSKKLDSQLQFLIQNFYNVNHPASDSLFALLQKQQDTDAALDVLAEGGFNYFDFIRAIDDTKNEEVIELMLARDDVIKESLQRITENSDLPTGEFSNAALYALNKAELSALPLIYAVSKGNIKLVNDLLDRQFAINSPSGKESALHVAVTEGHAEIVRLLIKGGVDLNATFNGKTPLQLAQESKNNELIKAFSHSDKKSANKPNPHTLYQPASEIVEDEDENEDQYAHLEDKIINTRGGSRKGRH